MCFCWKCDNFNICVSFAIHVCHLCFELPSLDQFLKLFILGLTVLVFVMSAMFVISILSEYCIPPLVCTLCVCLFESTPYLYGRFWTSWLFVAPIQVT